MFIISNLFINGVFMSFLIEEKVYQQGRVYEFSKDGVAFQVKLLEKKNPTKFRFLKEQETAIRQGREIKKKYCLFRLSLSVTANISTRSQIAINFHEPQRETKFFSAINTHLMKHSRICTSVPEHGNIITVLNYVVLLPSSQAFKL